MKLFATLTVKPDKAKSDEVKSDEVKSDEVKLLALARSEVVRYAHSEVLLVLLTK